MTVLLLGSVESAAPTLSQMLTDVGVLAILVMLAGLVLATGVGLGGLVWYVRSRESAPHVSEASNNRPQRAGSITDVEAQNEA